MQATITVPKSSENKTAIDQELEEQYKALQSNLYALKGHVDVGNVELLQQEEQLKKMDKNLTKIENNNIKANWMINSGRSTWGMIKSLFTKPTLVKDPVEPEETNQEGPEVEEGQVKFLESKDRLDEILRVTGDIKSGVKNQQAAIERTTKMVEKIDQREKKIIKDQQKLNDKITKWAK